MVSRLVTATAAVAVVLLSGGCSASDAGSKDSSTRYEEDLDDAKVVRGTVVAHDNYNLVVDYGGEFLALAEPALISADEYCASNYRRLSRWMAGQAPIGTVVWLDASRPTADKGEWIKDPSGGSDEIVVGHTPAFVYLDENDDELPRDRMTLNELAIRAGQAITDPPSWYPSEIQVGTAMSAKRARMELSAHDFGYWLTFNEAWMESWKAKNSPFGDCRAEVAALQQERREFEAEWEREQREFDRWYADLKRRSRQSTGSRNCDGDGDGICNE